MVKETNRNQMNHYILDEWISNHPEHKELASVMLEVEKVFAARLKAEIFGGDADVSKTVIIDAMTGQAVSDTAFNPYLKSHAVNPRVTIGHFEGNPEINIDKMLMIDLSKIKGVQVKSEAIHDGDYCFERYVIRCEINKLDYQISIVIKNN